MVDWDTMARNDSGKIKSIYRAFRTVELLQKLDGAGVTEVANELNVAKSTAHDYLRTLEETGFVIKRDRSYQVGMRFLDIGGKLRDEMDLYQIARPEIRDLAEESGELVNVVVEEDGRVVYIDLERGENAVNLDTYLGKRESIHSTAVGKAILAHRPKSFVDSVIEEYGLPKETLQTVTTMSELDERLETIRQRGYALDDEERLKGLCCVAAAITDPNDYALGAVSISGPTSRIQGTRLEDQLASKVMQTANIIEVNLTYS